MKDIALAGPAGVGKDTLANLLVRDYGFTRVAFADELKRVLVFADPKIGSVGLREMVETIGWDEAKKHAEVRRLLQVFGEAMRTVDECVWLDALDRKVARIHADTPVVLTDVRMPNELDYAKRAKMLTIHLDRPGVHTNVGWREHLSEKALRGRIGDFDLVFDGTWSPEQVVAEVLAHMSKPTTPSRAR